MCWGIVNNYVAIYAEEELGITEGTGIFFALLSAGLVLSRILGRKGLRNGKLLGNCFQGIVICLLGFILFALSTDEVTFYASALQIGLGNGKMYPALLNMFINLATPDQQGAANSSILISCDMGMGIGIVVGGIVAQHWSYHAAFWLSAVIQGAGLITFVAVSGKSYIGEKARMPLGCK